MMKDMSRRNFFGMMGAMGAAGAMGAVGGLVTEKAFAAEETVENAGASETGNVAGNGEEVILSDGTIWRGTPAHLFEKGISTMPLEELNRRRKEYVDSQTEFVDEEGNVVPEPYVKMRALIHTHGFGCGEGLDYTQFKRMMDMFTEEQAWAYLDMPWGVEFTVNEYYHKCQKEGIDRTYEECKELCEYFSEHTFLPFRTRAEGITYNIPGFAEGVNTYTYSDEYYADPDNFDWPLMGTMGLGEDHALSGTPVFYSVPLCEDVVAEESELFAYDDIEKVIMDHDYIAVQPCSCRYLTYVYECMENGGDFPTFVDFATAEFADYRDNNGDRIETCFALGDDAEYLVSLGLGRRITQEEALKILQQSRDDGFILHCLYGKEHAWVCQCNPKICGITAQWEAGAEALGSWDEVMKQPAYKNRTHYDLVVDTESCIKCGTCANRCPMQAISMDSGAPEIIADYQCVRCGQCAYVCPQEARKLHARPAEEILEMPHLLQDDYNLKAAWRFENNLIGRDTAVASTAHF